MIGTNGYWMVQLTEQARANYEFNRHHEYKKNSGKVSGFEEVMKKAMNDLKERELNDFRKVNENSDES